jgi:hypothetical protein
VDATSASFEDVETAIKKTGKVINSGKIVTPTPATAEETKAAAPKPAVVEEKPVDQFAGA